MILMAWLSDGSACNADSVSEDLFFMVCHIRPITAANHVHLCYNKHFYKTTVLNVYTKLVQV